MNKKCCDICLKEIPLNVKIDICDKHIDFADQFYREQYEAVRKAVESHRGRFLQTVVNRPRPLEAINK
jgi:hypothetical protein